MALESSGREEIKDKQFPTSPSEDSYINKLFIRVTAKSVRFEKIDFRYSIFDTCYLRSCVFDSCDFTGCRFIGTNFHGSVFVGCKFDYAHFERTLIDIDILDTNAPSEENLKLKFARSLRVNFQSLGDSSSVNKAINLELRATKEHLFKSWKSPESYYRKKYTGFVRWQQFFKWLEVKILDFIWGNGESVFKLIRTFLILWVMMALIHVFLNGNPNYVNNYFAALISMPGLFLGTVKLGGYPDFYLSIIALVRLILVSLLVSIIVKRFNRR